VRHASWLILLLPLALPPAGLAATKDVAPPDKEMLRMMDFLRDMEMIKQVEMMQDLSQVEQGGDPSSDSDVRKPLPTKKKEAAK
jgi:hypothetical protein